jgi:hypothetical protein
MTKLILPNQPFGLHVDDRERDLTGLKHALTGRLHIVGVSTIDLFKESIRLAGRNGLVAVIDGSIGNDPKHYRNGIAAAHYAYNNGYAGRIVVYTGTIKNRERLLELQGNSPNRPVTRVLFKDEHDYDDVAEVVLELVGLD